MDFIPQQYSQEGLLHDLPGRVLAGKRALILSAQESRDALEAGPLAGAERLRHEEINRRFLKARRNINNILTFGVHGLRFKAFPFNLHP